MKLYHDIPLIGMTYINAYGKTRLKLYVVNDKTGEYLEINDVSFKPIYQEKLEILEEMNIIKLKESEK